ncbi:hypothetical protein [Curtobacterium sp. CFBP9011]|uniref:hypothetical protein n=1 Tax=Curtobacterium sp. CFBP9011 TaxID=3096530 RepID=UPI002A6B733C|nr:hypothetical protein [Curtobacterium sp. CFBP9011]MDY1006319.1 hypothetical protein [Curtobacterium sp. CFBP9011]
MSNNQPWSWSVPLRSQTWLDMVKPAKLNLTQAMSSLPAVTIRSAVYNNALNAARQEVLATALKPPTLGPLKLPIGAGLQWKMGSFFEALRASTRISLPDIAQLRRAALPPNIADADIEYDLEAWNLWMQEGLPIAWVPDPRTLELVAAAGTPAQRRAVYGRRWTHVLNACEDLLSDVTSSEMNNFVQPTRRAIDGIRNGYADLGQSYAASILDSIVQKTYTQKEQRRWVHKPGADDQPGGFRNFFHLTQLQSIYESFWDGPVPSTFNRHGSAHAVGRGRQYSRMNAVLGVAHVASVIGKNEAEARILHRTA